MTVYVTVDGSTVIGRETEIVAFHDVREAIEQVAAANHVPVEAVRLVPAVEATQWRVRYHAPDERRDRPPQPFRSWREVKVRPPGTHPGGRCWWIEPDTSIVYGYVIEEED